MTAPGVALVTGAGRGIGAAVARRLAADGAALALLDVAPDELTATAESLAADGARVLAHPTDVTDAAGVADAVAETERRLGPVTTLVNAAGVFHASPVVELTDADWARCLAVNATGIMIVSRAVVGGMAERGAGSVVTVASNAAGVPRMRLAAYAASKAAAVAVTRCLGLELAGDGVRANVVCPGSTDTPMLRELGTADAELIAGQPELFRAGIPLGRVAAPGDVADAVAWLASDSARHVTLQTIYVDGGASLGP